MKKLLSLPPNLVSYFHQIENVSADEFFCTNDPVGQKLGSGGGTTWLLQACHQAEASDVDFFSWLSSEKRILLHAGGQSRRLPSYAPSGKILTPIPVFRWSRGQRIGQNLLQLQLPLYERIMEAAPDGLHTLIASGDVYIQAGKLQQIPYADVVCYGMWVDPSLAKNHGVFCSCRQTPEKLDYMLQKPSLNQLGKLLHTHLFLMDIGIWLLSDKAVSLLCKHSANTDGSIQNYDLYSQFGCSLGEHPTLFDAELANLSVAILPLNDGEFYHYGTSREMISSTMAIQNRVYDQRSILHLDVKPHPSIFIQNAHCQISLTDQNKNTWIENSWIGSEWHLCEDNIVTGVPCNQWNVTLQKGVCLDVVPMNERYGNAMYALRPYGMNDAFRGSLSDANVTFLGQLIGEWLGARGLCPEDFSISDDIQAAPLFPVSSDIEEMGRMLKWMISEPTDQQGCALWKNACKISANEISDYADLRRLQQQRESFQKENLVTLAANHSKSVFYQTNLDDMAHRFVSFHLPEPAPLPDTEALLKRINDQMFRSQLHKLRGEDGSQNEHNAFCLLRDGLVENVLSCKQLPKMNVCSDQIVWGSSPVRIDLAGGWTDTPPYCLLNGGNVVNLAIDLNGQHPLQTFVKPCREFKIVLRSIDLGAVEHVETYEQLRDFAKVGSPFSIPKAALSLAGFLPEFCSAKYTSLVQQMQAFGCGIEVTLLSAIPAGSGLGTSSILASTVLGAVNDFCGLGWDKAEICNRTLVLEQLLTTGGGWQDQYGGVLPGIKLLLTGRGFNQAPEVRWLNDSIFTDPQYAGLHLLYYTGITRTAKSILSEIVRGMFLYETKMMELLQEMKLHALDVYDAFQKKDYQALGSLVRKTWKQNQLLDSGTNPDSVRQITDLIDDLCLGYKLPGAGGGGYLYMMAKDVQAAARIRQILESNKPNEKARFVDMRLSGTGLQISRS